MPSCREIDPLFAPYIDGEASAEQRAIVDAHLLACPKCRHQTALQSAVRETVRTKLCRPCAPEALRTRCRAAARSGGSRGPMLGVSPTVLAAQLTVDHVTCFAVHDSDAPVDLRASEEQYVRDYGGEIHLPRVS